MSTSDAKRSGFIAVHRSLTRTILTSAAVTVCFLTTTGCVSYTMNMHVTRMPETCEELAVDLQVMENLPYSYMSYHSYDEIDSLQLIKTEYLSEHGESCLESWIARGDLIAARIAMTDTLVDSALRIYKYGFALDSADAELNARIALMYLYLDVVDSAKRYLNKAQLRGSLLYDVDDVLAKLIYKDSLRATFKRSPDSCTVTLVRAPTYTIGETPKPFSVVKANGETTLYDYFGDEDPDTFHTILPIAILDSALSLFEDAGYLTMFNPFENRLDGDAEFGYVRQWHLPNYHIVISMPQVSHTVSVYGLGTLGGENALRDVISYSYAGDIMNSPPNAVLGKRLEKLSQAWQLLMSSRLVFDKIKEKYGSYEEGYLVSSNYLYLSDSSAFVRLTYPGLEIDWSTPILSTRRKYQDRKDRTYLFIVENIIYGIDKKTGSIVFKQNWKLPKEPYLFYAPFESFIGSYVIATVDSSGVWFNELDDSNGAIERVSHVPDGEDTVIVVAGKNLTERSIEYYLALSGHVRTYYIEQ